MTIFSTEAKAICSLDRGICSNQFGDGFKTGCSSLTGCEHKYFSINTGFELVGMHSKLLDGI
jgi:hypothetical protein